MSDAQKPKPGALRWIGRKSVDMATMYPRAAWQIANPTAIRDEAENIRRLWAILRAPRPQGAAIVTDAEGRIDVAATAEIAGISPEQVFLMLSLRLRRTANTFWTCLMVGAGGFLAWVVSAVLAPPDFAVVWSGLLTLMFTMTLGAKALEAALHNWQVRAIRLGGVSEFLRDADSIFPRRRMGFHPL